MRTVLFIVVLNLFVTVPGCSRSASTSQHPSIKQEFQEDKVIEQEDTSITDSISVFGVMCPRKTVSILDELNKAGIISTDRNDFTMENEDLEQGIISFYGVDFGINPQYNRNKRRLDAFVFISSKAIDQTFNRLKQYISSFYGNPYDEEPYHCTWKSDDIYIKLRPLRAEEDGTVMIWNFWGK